MQMKPSSFPTGKKEESPTKGNTSAIHVSAIACPVGTVPIWRNQEDISPSEFSSNRILRDPITKKMHPDALSETRLYVSHQLFLKKMLLSSHPHYFQTSCHEGSHVWDKRKK